MNDNFWIKVSKIFESYIHEIKILFQMQWKIVFWKFSFSSVGSPATSFKIYFLNFRKIPPKNNLSKYFSDFFKNQVKSANSFFHIKARLIEHAWWVIRDLRVEHETVFDRALERYKSFVQFYFKAICAWEIKFNNYIFMIIHVNSWEFMRRITIECIWSTLNQIRYPPFSYYL